MVGICSQPGTCQGNKTAGPLRGGPGADVIPNSEPLGISCLPLLPSSQMVENVAWESCQRKSKPRPQCRHDTGILSQVAQRPSDSHSTLHHCRARPEPKPRQRHLLSTRGLHLGTRNWPKLEVSRVLSKGRPEKGRHLHSNTFQGAGQKDFIPKSWEI